jgi:hypothetical protein
MAEKTSFPYSQSERKRFSVTTPCMMLAAVHFLLLLVKHPLTSWGSSDKFIACWVFILSNAFFCIIIIWFCFCSLLIFWATWFSFVIKNFFFFHGAEPSILCMIVNHSSTSPCLQSPTLLFKCWTGTAFLTQTSLEYGVILLYMHC